MYRLTITHIISELKQNIRALSLMRLMFKTMNSGMNEQ